MPVSQRFPNAPRVVVAVMSVLLVSVVGMTLAVAQSSEPVSTGPLAASGIEDGVVPGEVITVSGGGFAPGGSVDITFESDPILLKTVRADAAGAFTTTVTIPSVPPGVHTLKATGPDASEGLRVLSVSVRVLGAPIVRTGGEVMPVAVVGLAAVAAGAGVLVLRRRQA